MRLTIRVKLALISLLLLTIPFAGIRVSEFIKQELLNSREDSLLFSAKAVSAALSGRPQFFDEESFHSETTSSDLYLHPLTNHIRLNGKVDDWEGQRSELQFFGGDHLVAASEVYSAESLSFEHIAGVRGPYLYALFLVQDDQIVYRSPNSLSLSKSDYLEIKVVDEEEVEHRYLLTAIEPGWVNGFKVPVNGDIPGQSKSEPRIQGTWREREDGYTLEIRLPMEIIGPKLAFSIGDVDDSTSRKTNFIISTTSKENSSGLGSLVEPSTRIEKILESLQRPYSRIQIVDKNKRLRASYGTIGDGGQTSEGHDHKLLSKISNFSFRTFTPVYEFFMTPFAINVNQEVKQLAKLDLEGVGEALQGNSTVTHYRVENEEGIGVEVMAAIYPLKRAEAVVGAVVVEQTTNSILALQNRIIEEFITLTILLFFIAGFSIIFFAFRLSSRIGQLGQQAAGAIDSSGKILTTEVTGAGGDEIGDLANILSEMLTQVKKQTEFRERMADNLEHEMRTPLAGVSASLKNLAKELDAPSPHIQEYLDWALQDVARLESLLSTIRDATNLQQALEHDEREEFDLNRALETWLSHSWKPAFPGVHFSLHGPESSLLFTGDPGRIHQMLDKLVENGVSFHKRGTAIEIRLEKEGAKINLSVRNEGPMIPEELESQIFNSMISSRSQGDNRPHLGLGLFIAREIATNYGGTVEAKSEVAPAGARFTISLPATRS